MAEFGLGNYLYTLAVKDGNATFDFRDPEDADNTATVSVSQEDFPEGITQADSRQVADLAYSQCAKVLNDKRDARIRKVEAEKLDSKLTEDARQREEAAEFHNNSQELANTTPTGVTAPEQKPDKAAAPHKESDRTSDETDDKKKGK